MKYILFYYIFIGSIIIREENLDFSHYKFAHIIMNIYFIKNKLMGQSGYACMAYIIYSKLL